MKTLMIVFIAFAINFSSKALTFTVGGINYTTLGNNEVSVDKGTYSGTINIPSSVIYSNVTYAITSIGESAFVDCSGLIAITISPSVISIGSSAFRNCTGLKTIIIPPSVISIGNYAFQNCSGLTEINIPSSVTSIGTYAFYNCTELSNFSIPPLITTIRSNTFANCIRLVSIDIPSSVTSIGSSAFYNCSRLESIIISSTVTSIGSRTFYGCTGLSSVNIPSSVNSIGEYAFQNCTGFITVDPGNTNFSSIDGVLYNKSQTTLIQCPVSKKGSFSIPSSVTTISGFAFWGCTEFTAISIPSSVTSIENYAFRLFSGLINVDTNNTNYSGKEGVLYDKNQTKLIQCPLSLKGSFIIQSTVTSIDYYAFSNCTELTSITIPSTVTSIGDYAFYQCAGLSSVRSDISTPWNLYSGTFSGVNTTTCRLYVPVGTRSLYNNASGWKAFTYIIETDVVVGSIFNVDGIVYTCNGPGTVAITAKTSFEGTNIPSVIHFMGIDYTPNAIGNSVFEYYTNFINISIPSSITTIGNYSFNSCTKLSSIEFPSELQSIGNYAFFNCTALTSIRVDATTPPLLGLDVFSLVDKSNCTLYVPKGCLEAYHSSAQWKDFPTIIEFDATAIQNINSKQIKIYPDMTYSIINVILDESFFNSKLLIFNSQGQKVNETRIKDNHIQLDLLLFPAGIYYIQCLDENSQIQGFARFIKK